MTNKEKGFEKVQKLVTRFSEQLTAYKKAEYNETQTRRDFIDPFFKALGWDIDNEQGCAESYREVIHEDRVKVGTATKAPDYSFRLSGGHRLFFVEAKKPSVSIKEDTQPAYQVRRYGWSAKLNISVITDFEEFSIYDCTIKPKLTDKSSVARVKYINYDKYLEEWDFFWDTFSKEAVLKGSFDKFIGSNANKKGTATVDKEFLISLDQWRTLLAETISKENKQLDEDELNFVVQQTLDRIIFLRICEDRSIEPYGSLQKCLKSGDYYKNLLSEFKQADEKYNSGLFNFKKDILSHNININNKTLKTIINQLYYPECPYEFSVLSVEILGSAYEQFLGKTITINNRGKAVIELKPEVRKAGGVYYTPQYIVDYIVSNTIGKLCENKTPSQVAEIKIVDPACGSGSFLLGAYQYLLDWHLDYYTKNPKDAKKAKALTSGEYGGGLTTSEKKKILLNNIHGVDIDTNAVEVTKLSLLLKCMEGETQASIKNELTMFKERVLPTLDDNIKSGNSLIDTDYYDTQMDFGEERKIKPFSWQKSFPDVFKEKVINEELFAYHVTWATYNSRPVGKNNYASSIILDDESREQIADYLDNKILTQKFRVLKANVLHDHVHIIIVSAKDDLPEVVRHLKGYTSYMYHKQKSAPNIPMLKHRVDENTNYINPTIHSGDSTADPTTFNPTLQREHSTGDPTTFNPTLQHEHSSTDPTSINPMLQHGDNTGDNTIETTKLWAKDYSHTFLNTEEHLFNAIQYIENNHLKHQVKELDYKFKNLTPLEKGFEKTIISGGFDVVIGNPPYVQLNMLDIHSQKYLLSNYLANTDLYTIFVEKSYQLVKNNNYIGFIIPSLFIKGVNYKFFRNVINKNSINFEIKDYGDGVFSGVKMPTCVCFFKKGLNQNDHFQNKSEFIFKKIITIKLQAISIVRRGLEIGRDKLQEKGTIVCLNGGDIASYQIKSKHYISNETLNVYSKNNDIFKSPKIIVRETGNRFFATLENENSITNRSLYNVCINNSKYHPNFILGIINSTLFKFYFTEFIAAGTNIFPKIRIAQLNDIPIPDSPSPEFHDQIVNYVEQLLQLNKDLQSVTLDSKKEQLQRKIEYNEDKINALVYQLYGLTEEEIRIVEGG